MRFLEHGDQWEIEVDLKAHDQEPALGDHLP